MWCNCKNYRAVKEYIEEAWNFVKMAEKEAGYPEKILYPYKDCQNLRVSPIYWYCVFDHLITNGMDPMYTEWFHHGL